ncbi:MAG: NUDIX domain-containing protein [Rhodanobacter sp.]|nr:MAG: NUDIX domain-containing protein [Rhodanobacter sp.]TAM14585.1 MAG: NUDIX domain-containing protein [Rhodanobacter sp.]TAM37377.1 MAG: NUDIX domain-containing protein [Rhodanobacter sp.]
MAGEVRRSLPVRCGMVAVVALRAAGDATRMLVAQRASPHLHGVWSYIAGHVDAGETGAQAALRELREETGLVPDAFYATSFCETFYAAEADAIEVVPAFVAHIAEGAKVVLNAEHAAYRWVPPAKAAALLPFGSQRELLAHVQREFIARAPSPFLRITLPR